MHPYLSHSFDVDKMLVTPLWRIAVFLPLLVDIEESQMVTLRDLKLLSSCISILLTSFRSIKDGRYRQHGHNYLANNA